MKKRRESKKECGGVEKKREQEGGVRSLYWQARRSAKVSAVGKSRRHARRLFTDASRVWRNSGGVKSYCLPQFCVCSVQHRPHDTTDDGVTAHLWSKKPKASAPSTPLQRALSPSTTKSGCPTPVTVGTRREACQRASASEPQTTSSSRSPSNGRRKAAPSPDATPYRRMFPLLSRTLTPSGPAWMGKSG